jgi:DNA invertase Pin-like site-specific DNA recombinase
LLPVAGPEFDHPRKIGDFIDRTVASYAASGVSTGDDARQDQGPREMYDAGEYTVDAIAETLGVSRKTVYRHLT